MADDVFACDYCRHFVPIDRAKLLYRPQRELGDGRTLVSVGVYCSRYCGDAHADTDVSSGPTGGVAA
jgi:hypothetical protein